MSHVLIVDHNRPLAGALAAALRQGGLTSEVCFDGLTAAATIAQSPPTVVVLDALLPGMTGLALCRRVRAAPYGADMALIVVTAWDAIEDKVAAFEAGCDDFLPKPFDIRELNSRVQALVRRYGPPEEFLLRAGDVELDCRTAEVNVRGRSKLLTPVEFDLLKFLMAHPGQAYSSTALLTHVWGYPADAGNNDLVRVHIHNLRAKLEAEPGAPTFLRTRPRHGYFVSADAAGAA